MYVVEQPYPQLYDDVVDDDECFGERFELHNCDSVTLLISLSDSVVVSLRLLFSDLFGVGDGQSVPLAVRVALFLGNDHSEPDADE